MIRSITLIALVGQAAAVASLLGRARSLSGQVQVELQNLVNTASGFEEQLKEATFEDWKQQLDEAQKGVAIMQNSCKKVANEAQNAQATTRALLETEGAELQREMREALETGRLNPEDNRKVQKHMQDLVTLMLAGTAEKLFPDTICDHQAQDPLVIRGVLQLAVASFLRSLAKALEFKMVDGNAEAIVEKAAEMMDALKPSEDEAAFTQLIDDLQCTQGLDSVLPKLMAGQAAQAGPEAASAMMNVVDEPIAAMINCLKGQTASMDFDTFAAMEAAARAKAGAAVASAAQQGKAMLEALPEMMEQMQSPEGQAQLQQMMKQMQTPEGQAQLQQLLQDPASLRAIMPGKENLDMEIDN